MFEGLVPYEVIDLRKSDFADHAWPAVEGIEVVPVALLPIEFGKIVRMAEGWAQMAEGRIVVEFGENEIVWKTKERS